jgi:hypothetical protein
MFFFIVVIFVALMVWAFKSVPRARDWIEKCDAATNGPFPLWGPPAAMQPIGVIPPRSDGIDWRSLSREVDEEGVHVVDYDAMGQRGVSAKRRNPANIAVFGIKCARRYTETHETNDLLLAMRQFEYFVESASPANVAGTPGVIWCADFEINHHYNVEAPWRSAYFQVFAMNALLWAYAITDDTRYRDLARRGLLALSHTTGEGGLCHPTRNGGLFFEEVVSSPLHHILNGHLHVLVNLHDIRAFAGFDEATPIIEQGIRATIDMLPYYDRYNYSLYSLAPHPGFRNHFNIANPYYHRAHIALLRRLAQLTGEKMFSKYAARWEDECGSAFDTLWALALIMFRDTTQVVKALRL